MGIFDGLFKSAATVLIDAAGVAFSMEGNHIAKKGNKLAEEANILEASKLIPILHIKRIATDRKTVEEISSGIMFNIGDSIADDMEYMCFNEEHDVLILELENSGESTISCLECEKAVIIEQSPNYFMREGMEINGMIFEEKCIPSEQRTKFLPNTTETIYLLTNKQTEDQIYGQYYSLVEYLKKKDVCTLILDLKIKTVNGYTYGVQLCCCVKKKTENGHEEYSILNQY